eukprot:CAMPEP_0114117912 /NCGR_PEP_ID=MMETSP0043_2-20121206/5298_1 /TAXON_ID=464988 /ORGANISM="Hemiselmis andersenii, Strain CCMP644" /LENGTH=117 /DNA_ID=CAMNT_0001210359 /DNA_START=1 /DNA_END=350 /DNA_ORIENTATION=+
MGVRRLTVCHPGEHAPTHEHESGGESLLSGRARDSDGEQGQRGAGSVGAAGVWEGARGALASALGTRVWASIGRVGEQAMGGHGRTSPPAVAGFAGVATPQETTRTLLASPLTKAPA